MTATIEPGTSTDGSGIDLETLDAMIEALHDFVGAALPESRQLELDHEDVCPEDLVRAMCGDELGVQLLFIPEQYGGMGGSSFDVYRVCEQMARIDIGLATSVLATFLGSDPLFVGGTPDQQKAWLTRIAEQCISNGGIADAYTILALAPGGPSWFVVERDAEGFTKNKPEDKHGIRLSNTAALF